LDGADATARDGFQTDLGLALQTADTALVPKTRARRLADFQDWCDFCLEHGKDATGALSDVADAETKLCYLLVYAVRLRRRVNTRTGKPIRSDSVATILLAVGQGIAALGGQDPHKEAPGSERNHPLLVNYLKALDDQDDPTQRAYPANITIIEHLYEVLDLAHPLHGRANRHAIDLCIIGFYWLLRPAEYLAGSGEGRSQAFRLQDISFEAGIRHYPAADASLNDVNVNRITRASLTFTDQKNAVRGELISHAPTAHPLLCPCKALARVAAHLRAHSCLPETPICTYYDGAGEPQLAKPQLITNALRHSATALEHLTGISAKLLSARSLRPGGATALLCAGIDPNVIQLLGRWKSDAMLRYLRVAGHAHSSSLAQRMLTAGAYTFAAHTYDSPQPVPVEAPPEFLDALRRAELLHS
jgi:hypothetical protein